MNMLVFGITGGIGSGKSTVAAMFARRGAKILDADRIVHGLMMRDRACRARIIKRFGPGILSGRTIDRRKIAAVVFSDTGALDDLTRIVHPLVMKTAREQLSRWKRGGRVKVAALDVPLLFESGMDRLADYTVTVTASKKQQVDRTKKRLGMSRADVLRRMSEQMPLRRKAAMADIVIRNGRSLVETQRQVQRVWDKIIYRNLGRSSTQVNAR
ncbi:MAG: dephospho-CoA kinase [Candidatus Omnitrophota bacterium]|nr:dephospho-CoA kinase [Candidatus Omnitrophota bacterium]MDZ4242954.1 dephospho-CoA kinase [Candidatus Omnitrophota bacterium]